MPKTREKNDVEFWRGKCRELEKDVRSLTKKLKSLEKKEHIFDDFGQDNEVVGDSEDTHRALRISCDLCGKGYFDEFEIMDKVFGTCNVCGERKKLR